MDKNLVQLTGTIKDVRVFETKTGRMATVKLQVMSSGRKYPDTFNLVMFNSAVQVAEGSAIGDQVSAVGQLRNNKYTDKKTGQDVWSVQVLVDTFENNTGRTSIPAQEFSVNANVVDDPISLIPF